MLSQKSLFFILCCPGRLMLGFDTDLRALFIRRGLDRPGIERHGGPGWPHGQCARGEWGPLVTTSLLSRRSRSVVDFSLLSIRPAQLRGPFRCRANSRHDSMT
jgi:hypothetical protein